MHSPAIEKLLEYNYILRRIQIKYDSNRNDKSKMKATLNLLDIKGKRRRQA